MLNCNPSFPFDKYNGIELSETVFLFYETLCNGTISDHQLMFDYLLPVYEDIFNEIGITNLVSQDDLTRFTNDPDLNWQDFLFFAPMEGLHETSAFENQIKNDADKYDKYIRNVIENRNLSGDCE